MARPLFDMTDDELMADYEKFCKKWDEAYGDIPEDKDCSKCPRSYEGHSRGMVTPCFDVCHGMGIGGICDEPTDKVVKNHG